MYGSNYYGQPYYGQGPAVGTTFTIKTVSATATTTASIAFKLLINKSVSATVTTTASLLKMFMRTLSVASVATSGEIPPTFRVIPELNIRNASTKINTLANATRSLMWDRVTKALNLNKSTKDITSE